MLHQPLLVHAPHLLVAPPRCLVGVGGSVVRDYGHVQRVRHCQEREEQEEDDGHGRSICPHFRFFFEIW